MNSQLEKAIQEAMIELDRMSSSSAAAQQKQSAVVSTKPKNAIVSTPVSSPKSIRARVTRASTAQQRTNKLIKIAPAPSNAR